jgi:hypothetical protein
MFVIQQWLNQTCTAYHQEFSARLNISPTIPKSTLQTKGSSTIADQPVDQT